MLLGGVKTFLYPSPLHHRIIPEVIYDVGATIMFGTDSFLAAYASSAHPYDFYSMRYVIAGAEKLKEETRQIWLDKFGIRILETYGATEASPAIAVNTPMYYKGGSVGRFLPKIEYFFKPFKNIQNGGRLCVKGPNIMLGYIKPENPGVVEVPFVERLGNNWYDTGDIAIIDEKVKLHYSYSKYILKYLFALPVMLFDIGVNSSILDFESILCPLLLNFQSIF